MTTSDNYSMTKGILVNANIPQQTRTYKKK
jgi:hypothetical protein